MQQAGGRQEPGLPLEPVRSRPISPGPVQSPVGTFVFRASAQAVVSGQASAGPSLSCGASGITLPEYGITIPTPSRTCQPLCIPQNPQIGAEATEAKGPGEHAVLGISLAGKEIACLSKFNTT